MSIKAEQVIEAYKETGLKPRQDEWFGFYGGENRMCGCGLTAMLVKTNPKILDDLKKHDAHDMDMEVILNAEMGVSRDYINGFTRGFDGHISVKSIYGEDEEEMKAGFADGVAAWKAVVKEFNLIEDY